MNAPGVVVDSLYHPVTTHRGQNASNATSAMSSFLQTSLCFTPTAWVRAASTFSRMLPTLIHGEGTQSSMETHLRYLL